MEDIFSIEPDQEQVQASITFGDLQSLTNEAVADSVAQETALELCKRSLENLSATHIDLLSLWLQKLLKAYFSKAVCCIETFKYLYVWFTKLRDEVSTKDKIACDNFYKLLTDALDFAEWAKGKLVKVGERLGHTTAYFLLSIVNSCLQLSIEKNMDALKEHETLAIELHTTVLVLLKEITANSSKIHARITPMLQQLIEITDFLCAKMSHLNAFVKTSRTMTNICSHYSNLADLNQSLPDWLLETLLHLCDTILYIQKLANPKDGLSIARDRLEEYFKVIQVYLIMLHNLLSCGVKHLDKSALDTIMLLLIGGEFQSSGELDNEMSKFLAQYMRPHVMQLYELIYQLEDFQNYLLRCLSDKQTMAEDYSEVCLDYVTVVAIDDTEIAPLTIKIVQHQFDYLLKDTRNFVNAARYNRLLEAFGSLLHVSHSAPLFKFMTCGLFQEDLMKQQACADVLMIFFRLEETSKNLKPADVTQAAEYYMKCNDSYAMFSQNTSQWHVQRLLKYFNKLAHKEAPIFTMRNYRYLQCVSPRTEQDQRMWMMRLQRILIAPLSDIEQYYEMLALMELLATDQNDWLHLIADSVKNIINSSNCQLLRKIYFRLIFHSNQLTQQHLLQDAMPTQNSVNNSWYMQKLLYAGQHSDVDEFKALASKRTLAADLLPILDALQSQQFKGRAALRHSNVHKWDYKSSQKHRCNVGNLKRKRSEKPNELICQIEGNVKELLNFSDDFDASDLGRLRSVLKNMTQFILIQQE